MQPTVLLLRTNSKCLIIQGYHLNTLHNIVDFSIQTVSHTTHIAFTYKIHVTRKIITRHTMHGQQPPSISIQLVFVPISPYLTVSQFVIQVEVWTVSFPHRHSLSLAWSQIAAHACKHTRTRITWNRTHAHEFTVTRTLLCQPIPRDEMCTTIREWFFPPSTEIPMLWHQGQRGRRESPPSPCLT